MCNCWDGRFLKSFDIGHMMWSWSVVGDVWVGFFYIFVSIFIWNVWKSKGCLSTFFNSAHSTRFISIEHKMCALGVGSMLTFLTKFCGKNSWEIVGRSTGQHNFDYILDMCFFSLFLKRQSKSFEPQKIVADVQNLWGWRG